MKRSPSDIINYIYWQQDSRLVVLPNDEWIKTAYDYTYAMREAAMKRLEASKQQMITVKNK